jgi:endonuclease/exonuclease/phosphatase family metal-dependent hydrolase
MKMDTFWLSPTPYVPGSRYPEQSICPRTCTEVVLQELASGKVFRMLNTHFDHEGSLARLLAAKQVLARLSSEEFFPDAPVVFVGDLNAEPDSPEMQLMCQYLRNLTEDIGITFHNFGGANACTIDYIYLKGAIEGTAPRKWDECRNGVYLSDHYPVCSDLTLL